MKVGFIGLGNVGAKLCGSLLRNGYKVIVMDLNDDLVEGFVRKGADSASSPKELSERCDVIITCLPSPKACSQVMESVDGVIEGLAEGKVWLEMSTTDLWLKKKVRCQLIALCQEDATELTQETYQFLQVVVERLLN